MELYNSIIKDTKNLLSKYTPKKLAITGENKWELCPHNELILAKETAFELGANQFPSTSFSCVTTTEGLVNEDEILLYGKDIPEIKSDVPFGRIVLLYIDDLGGDDQKAYNSIKNLEFIKYDVIPKGYMMRASSFERREQIRVSREAVKNNLNFETLGNLYMNKYKEDKLVKNVKIIFITENIPEFKQLSAHAKTIDDITFTLNHVLSTMSLDCASCELKPICDQVEGMRELHFKSAKKK